MNADLLRILSQQPLGTHLIPEQRLIDFMDDLPVIHETELGELGHKDSACPICFVPLLAILAEEEMAQVMDSPAHASGELGVTRLTKTCGHIFCRKDISKWILERHDSCPMCRAPFLPPVEGGAEATSPTPNQDGPEITREERQLLEALGLPIPDLGNSMPPELRNSLRSMGDLNGSLEQITTLQGTSFSTPNDHDDRSEFSGMYS